MTEASPTSRQTSTLHKLTKPHIKHPHQKPFTRLHIYTPTMDEQRIVRRISFSKYKLFEGIAVVASVIGGIIAFTNLTRGSHIFYNVPFSILLMALATISSIVTYLLSQYREIIIYEDGFRYKFTPFHKYDIDFSEIHDIKVINTRFKSNRLEFEMINVEDQTIKIGQVNTEKFNEIKNAIISAWKERKGYVTRSTPPPPHISWENR